jgi:hypothetical protein
MFPTLSRFFALIVQYVIAAAVGLFVIYSNILDEEIGDFRVTLLSLEFTAVVSALPNAAPGSDGSTQPTAQ